LCLIAGVSFAGDPAFWNHYEGKSPEELTEIHKWFSEVMQPGHEGETNQGRSCCGLADAFRVDIIGQDLVSGDIHVVIPDGKTIIPDGTKMFIPREKLQWRYGNPTGSAILFISYSGIIFCLVPTAGL
jgi:hypothetical protein